MKYPRLGEIVAASLREKIVSGEIADGSRIPNLDCLVDDFEVSSASVREALRILENEGLITVRRGKVGGATAHAPNEQSAAYMLGLVLQSRGVAVTDVASTLITLITMCATMCASREDRALTVIPNLSKAHEEAKAALNEDGSQFERPSRKFHAELVDCCGSPSMVLVTHTLESLWSEQQEAWSRRILEDESPDPRLRLEGLRAHGAVLDAIARGDVAETGRIVRQHLEHPETYGLGGDASRVIRATDIPLRNHSKSERVRWNER